MIARILAVALLMSASAADAENPSPQGLWARGDGKAKVRIEPCGSDLCAVNTWIKAGVKDEKVDDKLIMTVSEATPGHWTGKAFDPQRNLHYRLKMQIADKTMTTSGCVLGGLLCKGVNWTRIAGE